jgi:hypothetical protein
METGTLYNKERLPGKVYFSELLGSLREIPASVIELLKLSRAHLEFFVTIQKRLVKGWHADAGLRERVERLQSMRSVGEILVLTWVLESGEVKRLRRVRLKRVRKEYLGGLGPLPTHGSDRAGKVQCGTPAGTSGLVTRLAVVRQATEKWVGIFWTWWRVMEVCSIREAALRLRAWSDSSRETGLPDQLFQKARGLAVARRNFPNCLSHCGCSGTLVGTARDPAANRAWFGAGYYVGSGLLRECLVFPIHEERGELVAYAGRMLDGRSRAICFRRVEGGRGPKRHPPRPARRGGLRPVSVRL